MTSIFTSNYTKVTALEKAGIVPIAISGYPPDWFKGLTYKKLAPKKVFFDLYNSGLIKSDEYTVRFKAEVLDKLDSGEVLSDLKRLSNKRDLALLCYEKPGDFCHRRLVAEWLQVEHKIVVPEWTNNLGLPSIFAKKD